MPLCMISSRAADKSGRKKEDNMSIKLIAVDMDGTFLNDEMAYNEERLDVSCAYWFPLATANLIPRAFNSRY